MVNMYDNPERFGLEIVAIVDWISGGYEYDMTVLWRHQDSGNLYWGDYSGCSCFSPFEGEGLTDLKTGNKFEFLHHAQQTAIDYKKKRTWLSQYECERIDVEVVRAVKKAMRL